MFARREGPDSSDHGIVAAARERMTPEEPPNREHGALHGAVHPQRVLGVLGTRRGEPADRWMIGRDRRSVYVQGREADPRENSRYHPFVTMSPALPSELSTSARIS